METEHSFGTLLRRARRAAGLTQEEVAERAGVSVRTISDLERGVSHTPHTDTVTLLAEALGLQDRDRAAFMAAAGRLRAPASLVPPAQSMIPVGRRPRPGALRGPAARAGAAGAPSGRGGAAGAAAGRRAGHRQVAPAAGSDARVPRRRAGGCWQGGCQRRGGQEPYAPLLEALERHISGQSAAELRAALQGCAWLVRLLPELAGRADRAAARLDPAARAGAPPDVRGGGPLPGQRGRASGTLLVLDDLQWAGADALDLLATLVRSPRRCRCGWSAPTATPRSQPQGPARRAAGRPGARRAGGTPAAGAAGAGGGSRTAGELLTECGPCGAAGAGAAAGGRRALLRGELRAGAAERRAGG